MDDGGILAGLAKAQRAGPETFSAYVSANIAAVRATCALHRGQIGIVHKIRATSDWMRTYAPKAVRQHAMSGARGSRLRKVIEGMSVDSLREMNYSTLAQHVDAAVSDGEVSTSEFLPQTPQRSSERLVVFNTQRGKTPPRNNPVRAARILPTEKVVSALFMPRAAQQYRGDIQQALRHDMVLSVQAVDAQNAAWTEETALKAMRELIVVLGDLKRVDDLSADKKPAVRAAMKKVTQAGKTAPVVRNGWKASLDALSKCSQDASETQNVSAALGSLSAFVANNSTLGGESVVENVTLLTELTVAVRDLLGSDAMNQDNMRTYSQMRDMLRNRAPEE